MGFSPKTVPEFAVSPKTEIVNGKPLCTWRMEESRQLRLKARRVADRPYAGISYTALTASRCRTSHAAPFFRVQIVVILGHGRFEHRRAKIGRVTEVLRESVVPEQAEAVRITPAKVDITGIVPASSGVLEDVDGADGEGGTGHLNAGWEHRSIDEGCGRVRAPGLEQAGTRQRVVDKVCALQVESTSAQVSDFEGRVLGKSFLNGGAPLLDIL